MKFLPEQKTSSEHMKMLLGFLGMLVLAGLFFALSNKTGELARTIQNPSFLTATVLGTSGGTSAYLRNEFSGWVGFQFKVGSVPLTVTHLGRYVVAGSSGTHAVKLVNANNGTDVASGLTIVPTAGITAGTYSYVAFPSPVTLQAGATYYLVSQELAGGDQWYDYLNNQITLTADATPLVAVWAYNSTATYNPIASAVGLHETYGPVNLIYTMAAPPPSSTYTLSVIKSGTGSGTVTGSNATINCGTTCSVSLNSGTSVTLTATPSTGSTFAGWSGACTGTFSTCTLTMSASVMATATFNTTLPPLSLKTITLSPQQDHFFSVPSGQSLTLGDLSDFPSSPSVLSHTHEVLGFSQSPPTSFDSPSTTFYKLNGQWYKVGAASTPLPSTTPISPYFIVRSRATTVTTISVPSYVTYYGATVMNPPVRPWAYTLEPGKTYYFKLPGGPQLLTNLDSYVKDGTGFVKGGSTSADQILSPFYTNNTIGLATYYYRLLVGQTNTGWRSFTNAVTEAISTINNYIAIRKTLTNGRTSDWMPPPGTIYYGDSSATGNPNGVRWLDDFKRDYPAPPTTHTLSVERAGLGGGGVTGSNATINCGTVCSVSINTGNSITLTATPDSSSVFSGWAGDCSGSSASCTVSMNADKIALAIFNPIPPPLYSLSVVVEGEGTVSNDTGGLYCGTDCSESYISGSSAALIADPSLGSIFDHWSNCSSTDGNLCTVDMTSTKTVTAVFVPDISTVNLTVVFPGTEAGSIDFSPNSTPPIGCTTDGTGGPCTVSYSSGTTVTLTASSVHFAGWTGACSGTELTCEVVMNSDQNVSATFSTIGPASPSATLTVNVFGAGTVSYTLPSVNEGEPALGNICSGINSPCSGQVKTGSQIILTMESVENSIFEGWTGSCSDTQPTCTVVMTGDQNVSAFFSGGGPLPINTDPPPDPGNGVACGGPMELTITGFLTRAQCLLDSFIPFIIGLTVFVILWGIFTYITHAAEEEKRAEARKFILWGIIAVFFMLSIWGFVNLLLNSFEVRRDIGDIPKVPTVVSPAP